MNSMQKIREYLPTNYKFRGIYFVWNREKPESFVNFVIAGECGEFFNIILIKIKL